MQGEIFSYAGQVYRTFEPPRDKTNKVACAPNEDSDHLYVLYDSLRLGKKSNRASLL